MSISSISQVIPAGKEPAAVLRINEKSFARANIVVLGDGKDFRAAVARGCLRWPHAYLPSK